MRNYTSLIKIIFCVSILLLLGFKGHTQDVTQNLNFGPVVKYNNAIGLRAGTLSGLTVKHFNQAGNALEAIIGTHYDYKGVTGALLYEWHRKAFSSEKFLWFIGAGGHVGYYKYRNYYSASNSRYFKSGNFVEVGADGIIGLEYAFPEVPLTISIDAKPYLNLVGGNLGGVDGAISVRYTF